MEVFSVKKCMKILTSGTFQSSRIQNFHIEFGSEIEKKNHIFWRASRQIPGQKSVKSIYIFRFESVKICFDLIKSQWKSVNAKIQSCRHPAVQYWISVLLHSSYAPILQLLIKFMPILSNRLFDLPIPNTFSWVPGIWSELVLLLTTSHTPGIHNFPLIIGKIGHDFMILTIF